MRPYCGDVPVHGEPVGLSPVLELCPARVVLYPGVTAGGGRPGRLAIDRTMGDVGNRI